MTDTGISKEQRDTADQMVSGWNGIARNSPEAQRLIDSFRSTGYEFAYGAAVLVNKEYGYVRVVMPDGTYYCGTAFTIRDDPGYVDMTYPFP